MRMLVVLAMIAELSACSKQTVVDSRRSTADLTSEESSTVSEAYQIPDEEGIFVASAIRSDDLDAISQELVETYKTTIQVKPAQPSEASKPVETSKKVEGPQASETPKPAPAPVKPAQPTLPPDIAAKLAACYPQWEKLPWALETRIDIRNFTLDVQKLKKTNLQLTGTNPEVVFVKIDSDTRIVKVSLSMLNRKALYCVDIDAGKAINKLELINICGAKVGTVSIDAGRVAKNILFKEICP